MTKYEDYVGREVKVTKTPQTITLFGEDHEIHEYDVASDDTVIKEIGGLHPNTRVWLPNTVGTADYQTSRLNVHVTEGEDGKFTITRVNFG